MGKEQRFIAYSNAIELCKTNRNVKEIGVIARRAKPDEAIFQRLLRFARNDKTFPITYADVNNLRFINQFLSYFQPLF